MATYYVRSTGGDNSNDGSSFVLAKATLVGARAVMNAGDTLYVCSNETYPFVNEFFDFTDNTKDGLSFIGADLVDGSPHSGSNRAVISSTGTATQLIKFSYSNVTDNIFKNILFTGTVSVNGYDTSSYSYMHVVFVNCAFKNLQYGIYSNGASKPYAASFYDCVFDSCGTGIHIEVPEVDSAQYSFNFVCINCSFYNCTNGIHLVGANNNINLFGVNNAHINSCRFFDNTVGIYNNANAMLYLFQNVFYRQVQSGLIVSKATSKFSARNNIFSSNGTYGIECISSPTFARFDDYMDYNCFYSNTSGNVSSNLNGGVVPGNNNVFTDPLFVSTTIGSEDFSLQVGSPCLATGRGFLSGK